MKPTISLLKSMLKSMLKRVKSVIFAPEVDLITSLFVTFPMLEPSLNQSHLPLNSLVKPIYVSVSTRQIYLIVMVLISSLVTIL